MIKSLYHTTAGKALAAVTTGLLLTFIAACSDDEKDALYIDTNPSVLNRGIPKLHRERLCRHQSHLVSSTLSNQRNCKRLLSALLRVT